MIIKRINFMWMLIRLDLERVWKGPNHIEEITWNEIFGFEDRLSIDRRIFLHTTEIFLENSFTSDTKIITKWNSVEIYGVRLPTSVEDCRYLSLLRSDYREDKLFSGVICDPSCYRLPVLVWLVQHIWDSIFLMVWWCGDYNYGGGFRRWVTLIHKELTTPIVNLTDNVLEHCNNQSHHVSYSSRGIITGIIYTI